MPSNRGRDHWDPYMTRERSYQLWRDAARARVFVRFWREFWNEPRSQQLTSSPTAVDYWNEGSEVG